MHIGIVVAGLPPCATGGNPREALQIARGLASKGMKTTIVAPYPRRYVLYLKNLDILTMRSVPYPPYVGDVLAVPQVFNTLIRAVRREGIDILLAYCADSSEGLASPLVARVSGRHSVVRVTGNDVIVSARRYPFLISPSLTLCSSIATTTEYMRALTVHYLPQLEQKIKVVPIAVEVDIFNPKRDGVKIRAKYELEDEFTILTVCKLIKRKGVCYLIKAMSKVLQYDPKAKLIVLGDGPERHSLEKLTQSLAISHSVFFERYSSEELLPEYYAACDVFVLPSIVDEKGATESFGKVLVEAMACGKPVIGTKVGGIPYVVEHNKNGFLVRPRSIIELCAALMNLRNDEELKEKMGSYGRRVAVQKYSIEKALNKWIELFRNVYNEE